MSDLNKAPNDFFDNWNKIKSMSYKNVIELHVKRSSEKKILALIQFELDQFSECINSQRYDSIIEQSYIDGQSLGITGTPAFFIISNENQVIAINGAQPYDVFERVFDSILEN